MRIAALYDIHGNLPALEAVLEDLDRSGVDRIVVGGDVLPGPLPRECLNRLRRVDTPVDFIRGNGEGAVLTQLEHGEPVGVPEQAWDAVRWVAGQLRAEDRRLIAAWPPILRVRSPDLGDVLFCHATPRSDTEIFTRLTPESALLPLFRDPGASLVVCGHTHMQFDRTVSETRIINAGSVGMPFGSTGAHWALLDGEVELRHTAYDLPYAAARIRSTSYPGADEFARRNVLEAPAEAEILALYSRVEL